jgi:ribosome biogenesis GTPase
MSIKARIFRSSKRTFECIIQDSKEIVSAAALATLLKEDHLVVGDWVILTPPVKVDDHWTITDVEKRHNAIFRNLPREQKQKVIASNVDVMLIVTSAGKPAYKRGLIDRYLARSVFWNIPAFVVFNKMDLYDENAEFDIKFEAERLKWLNVQSFEVSSEKPLYKKTHLPLGLDDLRSMLKGKTAVLLGHSGVGKSRLITELSGGKVKLLSGDLGKVGKGAHTTTWAELIDADSFSLIDSPGVRSMSLGDLTKEQLLSSFSDVYEFSVKCQFSSNCTHSENSKGCFFQSLDPEKQDTKFIISRLESYKRVLEEVEMIPDWQKKSQSR